MLIGILITNILILIARQLHRKLIDVLLHWLINDLWNINRNICVNDGNALVFRGCPPCLILKCKTHSKYYSQMKKKITTPHDVAVLRNIRFLFLCYRERCFNSAEILTTLKYIPITVKRNKIWYNETRMRFSETMPESC